MAECLFCKQGNPAGSRFCSGCGSSLYLVPCDVCDAVNDQNASSCHRCGTDLRLLAPAQPDPVAAAARSVVLGSDRARRMVQVVASAVLLCLAGVVAVAALQPRAELASLFRQPRDVQASVMDTWQPVVLALAKPVPAAAPDAAPSTQVVRVDETPGTTPPDAKPSPAAKRAAFMQPGQFDVARPAAKPAPKATTRSAASSERNARPSTRTRAKPSAATATPAARERAVATRQASPARTTARTRTSAGRNASGRPETRLASQAPAQGARPCIGEISAAGNCAPTR